MCRIDQVKVMKKCAHSLHWWDSNSSSSGGGEKEKWTFLHSYCSCRETTSTTPTTTMTGYEFELREQDRWLPIANVARLMKNTLPGTAKVSKDAKECMQECVSEFISFVTSEASDRCLMEKRKTINGEDVLYSLHTLGFENYAEVLKIYLAKYRQQQALKQERGEIRQKKKKKKVEEPVQPATNTEEAPQTGDNNDAIHSSSLIPMDSHSADGANMSGIKVEHKMENDSGVNAADIFEYPMDESMSVIRGDDMDDDDVDVDVDVEDNKDGNKTAKYDPYVSQLYEQEYAGVSMNMSNPDYKGGASEGIALKKSHMKITGSNEEGSSNGISAKIEDESDLLDADMLAGKVINHSGSHHDDSHNDDVGLPLDAETLGLDMDVVDDDNVGVGVNVHLGNTESLDEINSRLNRNAEDAGKTTSDAVVGNNNDDNENEIDINAKLGEEGAVSTSPDTNGKDLKLGGTTKTPATTTTSDFLLLNDNIAGISETEEIVGLTNGHSGMYRFE